MNDLIKTFDSAVNKYSGNLYRLAYKFTRNQKDAEDIVQETYLKAYENLLKYPKDEIKWKPWLMRICINLIRNRAKKKSSLSFSSLKKEDDDTDFSERIKDEKMSALDKLKVKEKQKRVNEAMQKIPEKYQLILELRYMQELSYNEISDALDLPVGTVKVHINRAKSKLKFYLHTKE
ncbi:RNA polymerase sigma factor [Candidatus Peregrinibacteria bacterium]|jgi:RNA polymerase sigma-70 factor, ECF subfamily|nr:RNA polymerase sigma factor [Candidatus Peregrinibacteria bacterium]MBT4631375.1 RNA polymerase sigma factor [Candidatus Peregrinibacteria bacterium]MBT5517168.1 RNA polymerase sigma factor [Candidatus Peregrinibacteria bacterium]MBT5823750.1 RNA polymerase sigma factor [Candidatus Peregrinibacteria bacterium]